jgi:hypothetical protein
VIILPPLRPITPTQAKAAARVYRGFGYFHRCGEVLRGLNAIESYCRRHHAPCLPQVKSIVEKLQLGMLRGFLPRAFDWGFAWWRDNILPLTPDLNLSGKAPWLEWAAAAHLTKRDRKKKENACTTKKRGRSASANRSAKTENPAVITPATATPGSDAPSTAGRRGGRRPDADAARTPGPIAPAEDSAAGPIRRSASTARRQARRVVTASPRSVAPITPREYSTTASGAPGCSAAAATEPFTNCGSERKPIVIGLYESNVS